MTNQEAIEYLNTLYMAFAVFPNQQISLGDVGKMKESVSMAIKALEQEPKTGHWIEDDMTYCGVELTNYKCDRCGEIGGAWRKNLKPNQLPKYCQWCGARMESEDKE